LKENFIMNLQTHQGIEEALKWFLNDEYSEFEKYIVNFLQKKIF